MASISKGQIRELLAGPHQAVLSVGRQEKGPVAVPMSYTFNGDRFFFVTSPTSLHGRLMGEVGPATLTIQLMIRSTPWPWRFPLTSPGSRPG